MASFLETRHNASENALGNMKYEELFVLFLISHKLVSILFPSSIIEDWPFLKLYGFKSITQHNCTAFSSSAPLNLGAGVGWKKQMAESGISWVHRLEER